MLQAAAPGKANQKKRAHAAADKPEAKKAAIKTEQCCSRCLTAQIEPDKFTPKSCDNEDHGEALFCSACAKTACDCGEACPLCMDENSGGCDGKGCESKSFCENCRYDLSGCEFCDKRYCDEHEWHNGCEEDHCIHGSMFCETCWTDGTVEELLMSI